MTPGQNVLVADAPNEFASQVLALAHDDRLRDAQNGKAFEFVRDRFSLDALRTSISVVLEEIATGA